MANHKAILLLNGEPYEGEIDAENAKVYCCDGAYRWAQGKVRIDENVGDFDSLDVPPIPVPKEIYPAEKNMTDGEIALFRAIEEGAKEITIYGGGGKREDHFLGNVALLYAAHARGVKAEMITAHSRIFVAEGDTPLNGLNGKTVSLFPFFGEAHIIESRGLKYPLSPLTLPLGSTRGISNVVIKNEAGFVSENAVLVLINTK